MEIGGAEAIGEKTIVADALETIGEHMEQKAALELVGGKRHAAPALRVFGAIVLVLEGDGTVFNSQEAVVADGDAMGIATEIIDDVSRAGKRRLGVNDPFGFGSRLEVMLKGIGAAQRLELTVELELTGGVGLPESLEKEAPEQAG